MQIAKGQALAQHGRSRVTRHAWEQEHDLGAGTGDYLCTTCGAYVDPDKLKSGPQAN